VLFAVWSWVPPVWNVLVLLMGLFLIVLVLIQRGKGGGLAGAFGGVGGSSPFGSRAGDTFTRITIGAAGLWIVMLMIQIWIIKFGDTGPTTPSGGFTEQKE
jgi:preprotein translocase subunit SecG